MKSEYHTTRQMGLLWHRCKRVSFDSDIATWELTERAYDVAEAYSKEPHRELMRAKDDESLRAWVKAWGPLRYSLFDPRGSDPIDDYRQTRDELVWVAGLLASIEQPEKQRFILSELRVAKWNSNLFIPEEALVGPLAIRGLILYGPNENLQEWLEGAKLAEINRVCIHLVETLIPRNSLRYTVDQSRRGNVVKASLGATCLPEALHWMLLQDVLQRNPICFCEDCGRLIRNTSKRERKFCSPECGSRKSARDAQKRKRERKKATSGTQKAR